MLEIPSELTSFKDKLSGSIGSMNAAANSLCSKLNDLSSACAKAQNGVNSYYNSNNKATVMSGLSDISSSISKIVSSITGFLIPLLQECQSLIDMITQLENIKAIVDEQQRLLDAEMAKEEDKRDSGVISKAKGIIETRTPEFNRIKTDALAKLSEIKSKDSTVEVAKAAASAGSTIDIGEIKVELQGLKEGTYNKVEYVGKNGRKIKTYIYLPVGAKSTKGLPVTLYMGSDGAIGHALDDGVGHEFKKKKQYSGIVVVLEPEADKVFSQATYLDTAKEIADNVVKTYSADPNKISISGYSFGGSGVQHMIECFPGYFAQAVIIGQGTGAIGRESGGNKQLALDKIAKTKVHIICGTEDTEDGNFGSLRTLYNELKARGAVVTCEWRSGCDHNNINTFNPITVNGVKYRDYVEFCLAQSKA